MILVLCVAASQALGGGTFGVASDRFVINGTIPVQIKAGSIHYSRVHPDLWEDRLSRLAAMGLNAITTYVPWNFRSPPESNLVIPPASE